MKKFVLHELKIFALSQSILTPEKRRFIRAAQAMYAVRVIDLLHASLSLGKYHVP